MSRKTEIYTWRLSSETKAGLEEVARNTNRSVAQLLDEIVAEHLTAARHAGDSEIGTQRRLHAGAARLLGSLAGGPGRRSERTRQLVRARLKRRYPYAR
jgi:hypothetical protein